MDCKICNGQLEEKFNGKILKKYDGVKYYECNECGFISTEKPFWIDEAYENTITKSDVGYVQRNISMREIITPILNKLKINGKGLDYGGGYGMFTRMMRDNGYDFYCYDKYTKNLFSENFVDNEIKNSYGVITCFEMFEHLENPLIEIENMLKISKTIIFSTELIKSDYKKLNDWWYFSPETGQHISFFTEKSLQKIAEKYNLNLYTNQNNLHILTDKKLTNDILKKNIIDRILIKIYKKYVLKVKNSLLNTDYERVVNL